MMFYVDIRGGDYRDDRFLGVYRILKVSSEGMPPLWKENLCVYGAAGDPGSDSFFGRSGLKMYIAVRVAGIQEKKNRTIDRIHRGGGGPIIMGGGGGFGGFSGGGGGGSWGGGSSGGGGSISRF